MDNAKQQKIREILRKYIADDGLRPEYDGTSAWEIAGIILKAIENNPKVEYWCRKCGTILIGGEKGESLCGDCV